MQANIHWGYTDWRRQAVNLIPENLQLGTKAKQLAVGKNANGRLEVFSIAMNDRIYHAWQD